MKSSAPIWETGFATERVINGRKIGFAYPTNHLALDYQEYEESFDMVNMSFSDKVFIYPQVEAEVYLEGTRSDSLDKVRSSIISPITSKTVKPFSVERGMLSDFSRNKKVLSKVYANFLGVHSGVRPKAILDSRMRISGGKNHSFSKNVYTQSFHGDGNLLVVPRSGDCGGHLKAVHFDNKYGVSKREFKVCPLLHCDTCSNPAFRNEVGSTIFWSTEQAYILIQQMYNVAKSEMKYYMLRGQEGMSMNVYDEFIERLRYFEESIDPRPEVSMFVNHFKSALGDVRRWVRSNPAASIVRSGGRSVWQI